MHGPSTDQKGQVCPQECVQQRAHRFSYPTCVMGKVTINLLIRTRPPPEPAMGKLLGVWLSEFHLPHHRWTVWICGPSRIFFLISIVTLQYHASALACSTHTSLFGRTRHLTPWLLPLPSENVACVDQIWFLTTQPTIMDIVCSYIVPLPYHYEYNIVIASHLSPTDCGTLPVWSKWAILAKVTPP